MAAIRAFLASTAATPVAPGLDDRPAIAVVAAYTDAYGHPCRTVQETVLIDGRRVQARGDLCRQANGAWVLAPARRMSGR